MCFLFRSLAWVAGLCAFALSSIADTNVPVEELRIKDSKLEYRLKGKWYVACGVKTFPARTPLVHWGPSGDIERLLGQGRVRSDEVDYLVREGHGAEGGGFYVSLSGSDSASYGPRGIVAYPPRPMMTYDVTYATPAICPALTPTELGSFTFTYNTYQTQVPPPPEFLAKDNRTYQEIKPFTTVWQLRELGFEAIQFTASWLNIIDAAPHR